MQAQANDCLTLIERYQNEYPDSGVNFENICFCSFNHEALIDLKHESESRGIEAIKIAPGIKTATLFGKENVDQKTFVVKPDATYCEEGLKYLEDLIESNKFSAYDCSLWDLGASLIELAQTGNKQIHAYTSDFREYDANK